MCIEVPGGMVTRRPSRAIYTTKATNSHQMAAHTHTTYLIRAIYQQLMTVQGDTDTHNSIIDNNSV